MAKVHRTVSKTLISAHWGVGIALIIVLVLTIGSVISYSKNLHAPDVKGVSTGRYISPVFSTYMVKRDILYGTAVKYQSTTTQKLYLDLYQPTSDTETKRPAIIWIHGGGFVSGSKSVYDVGGHELGPVYAKYGYVSIAIDYRLADHSVTPTDPTGPAIITMAKSDALSAVSWVRTHATEYNIDPNKIIVAGHSSGAVIALYAAYDTTSTDPRVAAAVSISGAMHPNNLNAIQSGNPPSILLNGELDKTVPYSFAQATDARLTSVNVPHLFYHYPNVNHDMTGATDVQAHIFAFLYTNLHLDDSQATTPTPLPTPTPTGTTNARKSAADFDNNGSVNIIDFTLFMQYWWSNNLQKGDLNHDGKLSVIDYTAFMNYWYEYLHPKTN